MDPIKEQGELQAERSYLERTVDFARRQWELVKQKIQDQDANISAALEEMKENAPDDMSNLYSSEGFYDLAALSQFELPVLDQMTARETGVQTLRALDKMMDSPYFARIDFKFDGEDTPEKIYIGRATLMDQKTMTVHVHDWRAPISSVFYRFGPGPASFEAPGGMIRGKVNLKRQFEIRHGQLQYFFDADVQILDEFLRQLLSKHASPQMKTIVETIQKDQDIVIRDMENDVLLVQGAAGSGKTSIALHRIAYLMYQGLGGRLSASDILILSPNTVFEEYISHVLPDLGENNVKTMLFEELFQSILKNVPLYTRSQCIERLLSCPDENQAALLKSSAAFKGSVAFVKILERLAKDLPKRWIAFQDIDYNGQRIARRNELKTAICNPKKIAPLGMRLVWLQKEILEKVHALHKGRIKKLTQFVHRYPEHAMEIDAFARYMSIRESAVLLQNICAFTQIDLLAVYRRLFEDKDTFYRLCAGIDLPENIELIRLQTIAQLNGSRLLYDDAAAVFYLHILVHGCGEYDQIRQVVLDEVQDEHPLHFAILRKLFPHARYTILGDVNQTIGKQEDMTLFRKLSDMLGKEKSAMVTLSKSFRCTMEIWRFSERFLTPGAAGECFSRSGDEPAIHRADDISQMDDRLIEEVAACKEKGYQSIGLICKTEKDAHALHLRLGGRLDEQLVKNDSLTQIRGTLILPIYLAKGLEFDAVLVCDADHAHYRTEDDKRLLYIASTRALHRLNLFYCGEISPLLQ